MMWCAIDGMFLFYLGCILCSYFLLSAHGYCLASSFRYRYGIDRSFMPTQSPESMRYSNSFSNVKSLKSTSFSETEYTNKAQIFVCTNKFCREKGSDATMAAFTFLSPEKTAVMGVNCLGRCNKGPNIRILTPTGAFVEASMVRTVENVVNLLQTNLDLKVNVTSAEVLRLNYEGNVHLRSGNVDQAIDCYDKALELRDEEQEGVLLVMRGTALLQRAYSSRLRYRDILTIAQQTLPTIEGVQLTIDALKVMNPYARVLVTSLLLRKVSKIFESLDIAPLWAELKSQWPEAKEGRLVSTGEEMIFRATFTYSLYEYSLLKALQDLLAATVVLPGFAQAWRRAGDALSEYRLYSSAIEYYEIAIRLDESLEGLLFPAIERLRLVERIVENAEAKGWPPEAILTLVEDS